MQTAGAPHVFQFATNFGDALANQPTVGLDLGFARTAEKSEPAALALQMGPAAHKPASLVGEMGQLDLQPAFACMRAFAEDLENKRRAVEHFRIPRFLQIALLHGRERRVHDDDIRFECARLGGDLIHLAFANQCCRSRLGKRNDVLGENGEADRGGETHRFGEARLGIPPRARRLAPLGFDVQNERAGTLARIACRALPAIGTQAVSITAVSVS
jgi:hypothetical protein